MEISRLDDSYLSEIDLQKHMHISKSPFMLFNSKPFRWGTKNLHYVCLSKCISQIFARMKSSISGQGHFLKDTAYDKI